MARTAAASKFADPYTWTRSAASSDAARPVLGGLEVSNGGRTLCATDSHRLHTVELADGAPTMPEGLFARNGAPIDATFPNWRHVMPADSVGAIVAVLDVDGARPIVAAAVAACKTTGDRSGTSYVVSFAAGDDDRVHVNAAYLLAALEGMRGAAFDGVTVQVMGPLSPIKVTAVTARERRTALIMPVRLPAGASADCVRFTLDAFTVTAEQARHNGHVAEAATIGRAAAMSCAA